MRALMFPLLLNVGLLSGVLAAERLPVEVVGPDGTTVTVAPSVPAGRTVTSLRLTIHGLTYQNKVGVAVGNQPRIDLANGAAGVTVLGRAADYGGIGGAFSSMTVAVNLPTAWTSDGTVPLTFRFNQSDGLSSGFRVIGIRLLDAEGNETLAPAAFVADDPATWTAPLPSPTDVAMGEDLWHHAVLVDGPAHQPIRATCNGCHAHDGRDLAYFNFSNASIRARSVFHGLTATQGDQIASYIRSHTAMRSTHGRPWNPPYQPGPAIGDRPVSEWAAGAGLEAVLEDDRDLMAYLPGGGSDPALTQTGDRPARVDVQQLPIALQLPDWNRWLPRIHPLDVLGDAFTTEADMNGVYQQIRTQLSADLPGNYPGLSVLLDQMNRGFTDSNDLFLTTKLTPWTRAAVDRRYALSTWFLTKQWEIHQEFGLEYRNRHTFGVNGEGREGSSRQWLANRSVFNVSPHILDILSDAPPIHGDATDGALMNAYFANAWYWVQLMLNPGAHNHDKGGFHTVDWAYMRGLFGDLQRASGVAEPLRATLFARKAIEQRDNFLGPDEGGVAGTLDNPWWGMNLRDAPGYFDRATTDTWAGATDLGAITATTHRAWLTLAGRWDADAWANGVYPGTETHALPPATYVWGTAPNPDTNEADKYMALITDLRDRFATPEWILAGYAGLGAVHWPLNDWAGLITRSGSLGMPTGLAADPAVGAANLRWTPVAGVDGYLVERAVAAAGPFVVTGLGITGTTWTDPQRIPGKTVWYRISAQSGRTLGPAGTPVGVTPIAGERARWTFNGTGTSAPDLVGDRPAEAVGFPTALNHVPRSAGHAGEAASFSGAHVLRVGPSLHRILGRDATLAAWIRTTQTGGGSRTSPAITGTSAFGSPSKDHFTYWGVIDATGRIGGRFMNTGAWVVSATPIHDGTWHHVAITRAYATGEVKIYVDGALSSSGFSGVGELKRRFTSIGGAFGGTPFRGDLDDLRMADRVLTLAEIQAWAAAEEPDLPSDPPTMAALRGPVLFQEDDPAGAVGVHVADDETPAHSLAITLSGGDAALVTAAMEGTGGDRILRLTPVADAHGSTTVTLTVTDGEGQTAQDSVTVTIAPVNDPPELVTAPTIAGSTTVGSVLSATAGTWADPRDGGPAPTIAVRWQRADDEAGTALVDIPLATLLAYTVTADDLGKRLRLVSRATDAGGLVREVVTAWSTAVVATPAEILPLATVVATASPAESGPVNGIFTITLSPAPLVDVPVVYTVGGTAESGVDYTALSGTVTVPAGTTAASITVVPVDDALDDDAETIAITVQDGAGYDLAAVTPTASVTILDDELLGTLAVVSPTGTVTASEGDTVLVSAQRSDGNLPVTLTWTLTPLGTASAADVSTVSGSLTWGHGVTGIQTASLLVVDDTLTEDGESFTLTIARSGTPLGSHTVSILASDGGTPSVPPPGPSASAASSGGGGGCGFGLGLLLGLLAVARRRSFRRDGP